MVLNFSSKFIHSPFSTYQKQVGIHAMPVLLWLPNLISLSLRLILRDSVTFSVLDNLFLIVLISFSEPRWKIFLLIFLVYLAIEFVHLYHSYSGWGNNGRNRAHLSRLSCNDVNSDQSNCHSGQHSHLVAEVSDISRSPLIRSSQRYGELPVAQNDAGVKRKFNGKVMMFPCTLRHLRRSNFKDDYQHSYLYVGCPVGLRVTHSPLVTIEPDPRPTYLLPFKSSWFSVRSEDHAFNGDSSLSITQKLKEFLVSEVSQTRCQFLSLFSDSV